MAKEFKVPPVIFTSSTNPNPNPNSTTQRNRPATAPFQPPRSTSSIPFMPLDIGTATTSLPPPHYVSSATIIGGGYRYSGGFEDEPPLREELGFDTKQIWNKTISIYNPFKINPDLHEHTDLWGPLIFVMAFGLFQFLAGKLHLGIIVGWITVSALFLYVVFNMLAGRNGNLDLDRCLSLIGYCMLPIVILSALALFVPQGGMVIYAVTGVFVVWSTRVCTRLLVELASCGDEHRGLIAYACFLIYVLFSLLVVF